ncbi:dsRBD fold-containing protein [Nonomuraea sp. NPDC005650]|uniref:dsRBD fold-containing protein n=1 Tax=Nonomuraea sp. NPDC005650 TaxID=3157045 RepID=UPI0033B1CEAC
MEAKQWTVQVYISEDGDDTCARAVLTTRDDTGLTGTGRAHRNPADPSVPEIGDELAAARALADLAGKLAVVTQRDIAEIASSPAPGRSW